MKSNTADSECCGRYHWLSNIPQCLKMCSHNSIFNLLSSQNIYRDYVFYNIINSYVLILTTINMLNTYKSLKNNNQLERKIIMYIVLHMSFYTYSIINTIWWVWRPMWHTSDTTWSMFHCLYYLNILPLEVVLIKRNIKQTYN